MFSQRPAPPGRPGCNLLLALYSARHGPWHHAGVILCPRGVIGGGTISGTQIGGVIGGIGIGMGSIGSGGGGPTGGGDPDDYSKDPRVIKAKEHFQAITDLESRLVNEQLTTEMKKDILFTIERLRELIRELL